MSEIFNAFINIIHGHTDSSFSFKFIDLHSLLFSFIVPENDFKSSRFINCEIGSSVLITKCVSSNNDGFFPSWDESWNVFNDDWFSKNGSVQNVSDGTIGTFPHVFKIKFLDSGFIRSDSCAFDTDFTFFDGVGCINGDLVIGSISMLDTKIKVFDVKIQEWEDKLILDGFPDNSGHFITVKLGNRVFDFDFFELHQK